MGLAFGVIQKEGKVAGEEAERKGRRGGGRAVMDKYIKWEIDSESRRDAGCE